MRRSNLKPRKYNFSLQRAHNKYLLTRGNGDSVSLGNAKIGYMAGNFVLRIFLAIFQSYYSRCTRIKVSLIHYRYITQMPPIIVSGRPSPPPPENIGWVSKHSPAKAAVKVINSKTRRLSLNSLFYVCVR